MKNKKGNVAVIALIIVIVAITAGAIGWIFAKKAQEPSQKAVVTQPAPITLKPSDIASPASLCGKLNQFKNETWAKNVSDLYENEFLKAQGLSGELWPGEEALAMGCKINNSFIFIPEFFEFGCGRILVYDIKNNKLTETVVKPPSACADRLGKITDTYVEYFGKAGDGGQNTDYYGKFYFNENKIEKIN
jgi:hypothetical protein